MSHEERGIPSYWDRLEELAETGMMLLMEATSFMTKPYPHGCVSSLECDMLRVEWVTDKGDIRLILPWRKGQEPYIYWQFEDDRYGVDKEVTAKNLAFYLTLITN